jgi:hypothetical protein
VKAIAKLSSSDRLQALAGTGRHAYRTGRLLHHAYAEARRVLGRELAENESAAVRDGWVAERSEA